MSQLEDAHKHASKHREEVLRSELCGCFYCGALFAPYEIEEWVDEPDAPGATAHCPKCDIDSVIGDASGFPVTPEFLTRMKNRWFA